MGTVRTDIYVHRAVVSDAGYDECAALLAADMSLSEAAKRVVTFALQTATYQLTHLTDPELDNQIEYVVQNFADLASIPVNKARELLRPAIEARQRRSRRAA